MNIDPKNPKWEDRDRFVLSKGHVAPIQYAALAMRGFVPYENVYKLRQYGSPFPGHPASSPHACSYSFSFSVPQCHDQIFSM